MANIVSLVLLDLHITRIYGRTNMHHFLSTNKSIYFRYFCFCIYCNERYGQTHYT